MAAVVDESGALKDLDTLPCDETEWYGPAITKGRTPTTAACGRVPGEEGTWSAVESAAAQLEAALDVSEDEYWHCVQIDPTLARCVLPLGPAPRPGLHYGLVLMIENTAEFGARLDPATLVDLRPGEFAVVVTNVSPTLE